MAKSRAKKVILSGTINREKAEDAFAEYADADARQQALKAKMDIQMTNIREKYADDLTRLQEVKELAVEKLLAYATDHRDEWGKRKSIEFNHGIIGFRTGTPKIKTLKGYTWESVKNLLKEFLPDYVRSVEEPAKDRLLADREVPEVSSLFPKCGVYVDKDETFFVEPKKEEAPV